MVAADPARCPGTAAVAIVTVMETLGEDLLLLAVRPNGKLGATAKKGTTEITLSEPVTGWRVGDRVLLTPTARDQSGHGIRRSPRGNPTLRTEERSVKAIDGQRLTLDQPLQYDHAGEGDYRGEVANLSRNVVVESADPDKGRGHTMYHRNSAGAISYAEFRSLGMEGVLGRYPIHFHLAGESMRKSRRGKPPQE